MSPDLLLPAVTKFLLWYLFLVLWVIRIFPDVYFSFFVLLLRRFRSSLCDDVI